MNKEHKWLRSGPRKLIWLRKIGIGGPDYWYIRIDSRIASERRYYYAKHVVIHSRSELQPPGTGEFPNVRGYCDTKASLLLHGIVKEGELDE